MRVGSTYGCLTVFDLGEEYIQSEQYLHAQKEYDALQSSLNQYDGITEESEKVKKSVNTQHPLLHLIWMRILLKLIGYSRNLSNIESIGFVKIF